MGWAAESGLFAVPPEENRVVAVGTSMEAWVDHGVAAVNRTAAWLATQEIEVDAAVLRWGYVMLMRYASLPPAAEVGVRRIVDATAEMVLVAPLSFARATNAGQSHVGALRVERAGGSGSWEVFTQASLETRQEVRVLRGQRIPAIAESEHRSFGNFSNVF